MTATLNVPLATVNDSAGLRACLGAAGERGRQELFAAAEATLTFSRHHWLLFDGEYHGRKELKDAVAAAAALPAEQWTAEQADLLLCLLALRFAAVGLEQLDERLTVSTVRDVLVRRLGSYLQALGHPRTLKHLPLIELAQRVSEVRGQIERDHHRVSIIDGRKWYRDEGLLPRSTVEWQPLPDHLLAAFRELAPEVDTTRAVPEYLAAVTRRVLAEDGEGRRAIDALVRSAVADPELRVDHATVTCLRGVLLDRPQELSSSDQFFTHTAMAEGLDLAEYAEQLGHESEDRLRATLRARMIKLKRKAVDNYYGSGCLAGEWIEKAADNMIFFHEDSHYRGHQTVGVSTGGRAAYEVSYTREDTAHTLPPMMGDFRVVRLSHDPARRFTIDDLRHVIRYATWTKHVVQETFRAQGVLQRLATDAELT
ncbi:hypothetical protein [Actinophytocola sp.]|uniref:hypothetical protein n=1 Tax=Actinophytocola sp. TaxID=1872138 RepID=UPI003899CA3A